MNPLETASAILVSFQGLSIAVRKQRKWESRRAQVNAKADLGHHRNGFKDTLELMLGPFVDKEGDFEDLCRDPGLEKWKALGLHDALQQVYLTRYELIQDNLESLSVILEDIQSYLEETSRDTNTIHSNSFTASPTTDSNAKLLPRNQTTTTELFKQFGKYNERLRTLVGADNEPSTQDIATPQRRLPPSTIGKPIVHFWQAAKTLYDFINSSWHCACQKEHYTNLLLQHRTHSEVEFNVLFLFESRLHRLQQPWTWQDIRFKQASEKREEKHEIAEPILEMYTPLVVQDAFVPRVDMKHKKYGLGSITRALKANKVIGSFGLKSKRRPTKSNHPSAPLLATEEVSGRKVAFSAPDTPMSGHGQVNADLCLTFKAHRLQQTWFQVQLRSDNTSFVLCPATKYVEPPCQRRIKKSLGNLLVECDLNRSECCFIALVLASSVYQLHSSPWLQGCWKKEQIMFFSGFNEDSKIMLDKPFLSGEHLNTQDDGQCHEQSPGDSVVESLGIALLELCFNKPLESFTEYKEKGEVKPSHSYSRGIANSSALLEKASHQMGPDFANTIRWCLAHRQVNPNDDTWRNELFINVMSPLYQTYWGEAGAKQFSAGEGVASYGDVKDGGVAIIGNAQFGDGSYNFGGKHVTYNIYKS